MSTAQGVRFHYISRTPIVPPPPIDKDSPYASASAHFQQEAAFLPRSAMATSATLPQSLSQPQTQPPAAAQGPVAHGPLDDDAAVQQWDDDAELYIPGLTSATLFTSLPATDAVTVLVDKYLAPQDRPPRDLSGAWQGRTLDELVLWSLRLHSLLRLKLVDHFSTEVLGLWHLLPESTAEMPFHPIIPFELYVHQVSAISLKSSRSDAVVAISRILKVAKTLYWAAQGRTDASQIDLWQKRVNQLASMLIQAMTDMHAMPNALNQLQSSRSSALDIALARFYIATGDVASATDKTLSLPDDASDLVALKARVLAQIGRGDWTLAQDTLRQIIKQAPHDIEARNNLAVVLLFCSRLQDAIQVYYELLNDMPDSVYASETVLFNLATLLELRTEAATASKIRLLKSVAERGVEGLRGGCLKLAA
ncbi:hypothetical protein OIO90_003120 [Microbotryomycetes sp. JL221]|nr:hypothetical protein OIO90_003120 [Microbotryomycetes sp. JL221]